MRTEFDVDKLSRRPQTADGSPLEVVPDSTDVFNTKTKGDYFLLKVL